MAKHSASSSVTQKREGAIPFVLGIAFFFLLCLLSNSTVKPVTMGLMVAAVVVGIIRFSVLRRRLALPMVCLTLLTIMGGISTQYALSGKFGLYEFIKVMAAFCVAVLLLALAPEREDGSGAQWLAAIVSTGSAVASLVSIDLLSTRLLSGAVTGLLGIATPDYASLAGVESGIRMTSVFTNPNVFAGGTGIAVLLGLGLVLSTKGGQRVGHIVCLFLNALAFVLAFSMGASGVIAAAFLVYLLFERKERRGALLVLMVETLIPVAVGAALISMTAFTTWDGMQPVPLLCAVGGAAVLWALDRFVGQKLTEALTGKETVIWAVIGVMLAALVAFGLAAYHLTGSAELAAGEHLRRGAYPAPGSYVVETVGSGSVNVTIESQNQKDTMMHTSTVIYSGDLAGATFEVPEDSLVVYFNFAAQENAVLEEVRFVGPETGSVPLGYKLLPGFIANRLQGLWANQNAIQRTVFFEDGMKLFRRSPVIGLGMGSFENGIKSVQSFYYETKYVHNHYIQALVDNGVIGLVLFVGVLGTSIAALWLERRKETGHAMVPALLAAVVFMAGHAFTEVVFSFYSYLPVAFAVFALVSLCCADTFPMKWARGKGGIGYWGAVAVLVLVFAVALGGNMWARSLVTKNPTMGNLSRAAQMDRFEWADYKLSYVNGSLQLEVNDAVRAKANEYAEDLSTVSSNTIPFHLADYYFATGDRERGFEMIKKYVNYVASDEQAWNKAFELLLFHQSEDGAYLDGVREIFAMLDQWNEENMGAVELDQKAAVFRMWVDRQ